MPPHTPIARVAPLLLRREAQGCFFAPSRAAARGDRARMRPAPGGILWFPCVADSRDPEAPAALTRRGLRGAALIGRTGC